MQAASRKGARTDVRKHDPIVRPAIRHDGLSVAFRRRAEAPPGGCARRRGGAAARAPGLAGSGHDLPGGRTAGTEQDTASIGVPETGADFWAMLATALREGKRE